MKVDDGNFQVIVELGRGVRSTDGVPFLYVFLHSDLNDIILC